MLKGVQSDLQNQIATELASFFTRVRLSPFFSRLENE